MLFSCIKLYTNISNLLIRVLNSIKFSHTEILFHRLCCILSEQFGHIKQLGPTNIDNLDVSNDLDPLKDLDTHYLTIWTI